MRNVLIACVVALAALAGMGRATQVPRLSFEEVVRQSDQIVTGKVVRSWTAWGPSHEFLWTHYEVQVASVAKGRAAASVTVSEPGGVLDGRAMDVDGAVHYAIGERVVLFLQRTPIGYNRTVGWQQGKYTITGDGRVNGEALAEWQTRVAALVRKGAVSR